MSLVCTLTVNNSEEPYSATLVSMQYSMGIAPISLYISTATETPQQRYGNMVLLEGYQSDIALIQS